MERIFECIEEDNPLWNVVKDVDCYHSAVSKIWCKDPKNKNKNKKSDEDKKDDEDPKLNSARAYGAVNKAFAWKVLLSKIIRRLLVQSQLQVRLIRNTYNNLKLLHGPVSWGCRIHRLLLCRWVRHPHSGYDTKQFDGKAPLLP